MSSKQNRSRSSTLRRGSNECCITNRPAMLAKNRDTPINVFARDEGDTLLLGKVDLSDLVALAKAYGSKPGDANWNSNADINNAGVVNLADLVTLAQHYGQSAPQ